MDIGIDIGGSHVGVGLISSDGKVVKCAERYLKNNRSLDVKKYIVHEIAYILRRWNKTEGIKIERIGIGAPGNIKDGEIKFSSNLGVKDFKLVEELKKYFPDAEIKLFNDAKCSAMAEKRWGSLKAYGDCVFLCLGTGIGGAAFYKGKMLKPKRSGGFEFGHMSISKNGRPCRCGSRGCFEQYCSMRSFKNNIRRALDVDKSVDGRALLKIVKQNINDERVQKVIEDFLEYLCVGISNIVNILEPQAVCIGGGFVKYKEILLDRFKEKFKDSKYLFYKDNIPEIVVAEQGNDAGMIGSVLGFEERNFRGGNKYKYSKTRYKNNLH